VDCQLFLESVEENYFKQHVQCATRQDAMLDLIFTDEENMIDHVESLGPLATSDHSLLRWNLLRSVCEVESGANRSLNILNLDYRRGDFVSFQS